MNIENGTDIAALLRGESRRMKQQARQLAHTVDMLRDTQVPRAAATAQVRRCEEIAENLDNLSNRVDNPPRRLPLLLVAAVGLGAMAAGAALLWRRDRELSFRCSLMGHQQRQGEVIAFVGGERVADRRLPRHDIHRQLVPTIVSHASRQVAPERKSSSPSR